MIQEVARGFAAWASAKLHEGKPVEVVEISQVPGGASRETFIIGYRTAASGEVRKVVLRRDPEDSLIETERSVEYRAYAAFAGSDVPVPAAVGLEYEPQWLKRPFSVMEMVEGCQADPKAFEKPPLRDRRDLIGAEKFRILGRIAAADPQVIGANEFLDAPEPAEAWSRELDYWAGVAEADEIEPQPVLAAAVRALRREPPPAPSRISVIHGDYRSGNFLFDAEGNIRAVLDWEMCHLGDPLEDIAWAFNPLYCGEDKDRVGRLISREGAIGAWEEASGLKVDPEALRWWELFTSVKALAIYISAARVFADGGNKNLIMILPAWFGMDQVDRIALRQLEEWR